MSVVLYKKGKRELFSPHNFHEYLKQEWYYTREESLNELRKREVIKGEREIEGEAEEKTNEKVLKRKRTTFKCDGCKNRRTRYIDKIITNKLNKRFCSEDCKSEYENKIINELSVK